MCVCVCVCVTKVQVRRFLFQFQYQNHAVKYTWRPVAQNQCEFSLIQGRPTEKCLVKSHVFTVAKHWQRKGKGKIIAGVPGPLLPNGSFCDGGDESGAGDAKSRCYHRCQRKINHVYLLIVGAEC